MKFIMGIAAIVVSTFCLMGLIYAIVDKTRDLNVAPSESQATKGPDKPGFSKKIAPSGSKERAALTAQARPNDDLIIRELASLSDAALAEEFANLREHIRAKNYYSDLEGGRLNASEAAEAKKALERFSLLSLEGTRRKYVSIEPELKDALFAHRDSLKDIRQTLSRY